MLDVDTMMRQQAAWQRSRAKLPWSAKLRMALVMREAQRSLRRTDTHMPSTVFHTMQDRKS